MKQKIILSSDSTCDIGNELKQRYNISYYPFHIILDEKQYSDGIDISPKDIYKVYHEKGILPKTAAIGYKEYLEYFKPFVEDGYKVIHINISSALSCAYQNCVIAAKELGNVHPIDSCNLSSGTGILLLEAACMIEQGLFAEDISKNIKELTGKVNSSFVLDTLKFLQAGGRCSSIASIGASLFKIRPRIDVDNRSGNMKVGKKYRGDSEKVLMKYADDILSEYKNIKDDRIFIVNSGISDNLLNMVYDRVKTLDYFKEIYLTTACCTISSHCGPNTLGIMYMSK